MRDFFYKTIIEYAKEGFKTDTAGEELWKKLAPYFDLPSRVLIRDRDIAGSTYEFEVTSEDFSRVHFTKFCKKKHSVDIVKERNLFLYILYK